MFVCLFVGLFVCSVYICVYVLVVGQNLEVICPLALCTLTVQVLTSRVVVCTHRFNQPPYVCINLFACAAHMSTNTPTHDCAPVLQQPLSYYYLSNTPTHTPLLGLREFVSESVKLAYGDESPVIANKQVAAVQSLSGTGSCRLFAEFQKRFLPNSAVYIPVVSQKRAREIALYSMCVPVPLS